MTSQHMKSFGLPRSRKITKADAFASALRMRVCARTEDFVLHFMAHRGTSSAPSLTEQWPQMGLVVPKRLAKHAVRRNIIKRLAREYFRLHADQLGAGLWVVRLQRNINELPLSPLQKKCWSAQLADLFAQGHRFSVQMATRPSQRGVK